MAPIPFPNLPPGRSPRVLLVEDSVSTMEPILKTFQERGLDMMVDQCTSPGSALTKMLGTPYQLIISGARLAERNDFFFFSNAQVLETHVPFIITAGASEKMSAGRILDRGAFDLLACPLNPEEAIHTVKLALWHSQLKAYLARREQMVEAYRQHLAKYPGNGERYDAFKKALATVQQAVSTVESSHLHIEQSMGRLFDLARQTELRSRQRAFERLNTLST